MRYKVNAVGLAFQTGFGLVSAEIEMGSPFIRPRRNDGHQKRGYSIDEWVNSSEPYDS